MILEPKIVHIILFDSEEPLFKDFLAFIALRSFQEVCFLLILATVSLYFIVEVTENRLRSLSVVNYGLWLIEKELLSFSF